MFRSTRSRILIAGVLAAVGATAAFGFANSNTVPATGAGDGHTAVSGYTVTAVTYTLETEPSLIDKYQFTLTPIGANPAPTVVKAKLVAAATTYTTCTNSAGTTWVCDPAAGAQSVLSADDLRIIAVQ